MPENGQNTRVPNRSSLTRLLHKQSVAQAAVLIAVITFLSKFVGFAREVVIARQFGATGQTDAFLVGMMVPSLVLGLFAGGLGTLIVPWYLGHRKEDPERARLLVRPGHARVGAHPLRARLPRRWALAPQHRAHLRPWVRAGAATIWPVTGNALRFPWATC